MQESGQVLRSRQARIRVRPLDEIEGRPGGRVTGIEPEAFLEFPDGPASISSPQQGLAEIVAGVGRMPIEADGGLEFVHGAGQTPR